MFAMQKSSRENFDYIISYFMSRTQVVRYTARNVVAPSLPPPPLLPRYGLGIGQCFRRPCRNMGMLG